MILDWCRRSNFSNETKKMSFENFKMRVCCVYVAFTGFFRSPEAIFRNVKIGFGS